MNNLECSSGSCPVVSYQTLDVCVPVSVKPFAKIGLTKTTCHGDSTTTSGSKICRGTPNGECCFIVSQKICIEVPVEFGSITRAGDIHVLCERKPCDCLDTLGNKK